MTTERTSDYFVEAIEEVRRRLLDQSGRSRLLNYREVARDIPIIDELPDQVFEHLVLNGKRFYFDALADSEEGLEPPRELPSSAEASAEERYRDSKLQTPFARKELDRRLLRLYREHRTIIEETGANNLYLAIGFLVWIDDRGDAEPGRSRLAPLMLVPVRVQREGAAGATRFSIAFDDGALDTNYSLLEKLRTQSQFHLPHLGEEVSPEDYWREVEQALESAPHSGWAVARQMTLGLFSFQKQVMWHDLHPERWPKHAPLHDKGLIRRVLTGAAEGEKGPGPLTQQHPMDEPDSAGESLTIIRDADSSQHMALVDALTHGDGVVIEGPPGTGKSQTITNLIASAIGQGKSVLFVAEKMAALDVVYRRLEKAGLGQFCLQLHGLRTGKADLIASLASRLKYTARRAVSVDKKRKEILLAKERLLDTSKAHSRSVGPEGLPVYELAWRVEKLRCKLGEGTDAVELPDACDLDYEGFSSNRALVEDFGREWDAVPERVRTAWRGLIPAVGPGGREVALEALELGQRACADASSFFEEAGGGFDLRERPIAELFDLGCQDSEAAVPEVPSGWHVRWLFRIVDAGLVGDLSRFAERCHAYVALVDQVSTAFDFGTDASEQYAGEIVAHLKDLVGIACSEATTVSQLASERDALDAVLAGLRELAQGAVPVLSLVGGHCRSLEDYRRIKERATALMSGPPGLRTAAHPAHTEGSTVDLLADAESMAASLAEEAEALQDFDLGAISSPEDLTSAVDAVSRYQSSWIPIISSSYRQARTYIRGILRDPRRFSRDERFLSNLRALSAHLDSRNAFAIEPTLTEQLGPAFKGVETDWEALRSIVGFSQELRRDVGRERAVEVLADWRGHLARMEDAREDIERRVLLTESFASSRLYPARLWARPVVEIESTLLPWANRLGRAVDRICQPWCAPSASIKECLEAEEAYRKAKRMEAEIEADSSFAVLREDFWKRSETRVPLVDEALSWLVGIQSTPGMTLSILRQMFVDPDTLERERLGDLISACRRFLDLMEDHLKALERVGELDRTVWADWDQAIGTYTSRLSDCQASVENLPVVARLEERRRQVVAQGLEPLSSLIEAGSLPGSLLAPAYEFAVYSEVWRAEVAREPLLSGFGRESFERLREQFRDLDLQLLAANAERIASDLCRRGVPEGVSRGRVAGFTELGLIRNEVGKKKRYLPVRQLVGRAANALQAMKPCFLMSPLSVAQFLAPGQIEFDLVVMDEASQIRPEDALGALARGRRGVVVGDPNQLPPTRFFDAAVPDDDDDAIETSVDDSESILEVALKQLPYRRLRWHYRSEHEALIQFSNERFYENDLVIFPSPKSGLREGGVHSNFVESSSYRKGRNHEEARAVVDAIVAHYRETPNLSLGVAAFNKRQAEEVLLLLDRARQQDPVLDERIRTGHPQEPFFVKNLENVQGDERDVIFISTTYGPDRDSGRVFQRFGPLGSDVGWRRLNVIVTRAKKRVEVFTSMRPSDIVVGEDARRGARELRAYLEYAETGRVKSHGEETGGEPESPFEESVGHLIQALGYEVVPQVGVEGFFIDIGVRHPDRPGEYLLGVECDGAAYHSAPSVRDRDRLRQEILESKGWRIHRIWSTAWFHERHQEVSRLQQRIQELRERDRIESERRRDVDRARTSAKSTVDLEAGEAEEALFEERSLAEALERYWEKQIQPSFPERSRSILSHRMVTELLAGRPTSEKEWAAAIPEVVRQEMDPRQRDYLEDVLALIAEFE